MMLQTRDGKTAAKSLQATRNDGFSSVSQFTSFGPACLISGRWTANEKAG
jgi:hypothetical protein